MYLKPNFPKKATCENGKRFGRLVNPIPTRTEWADYDHHRAVASFENPGGGGGGGLVILGGDNVPPWLI